MSSTAPTQAWEVNVEINRQLKQLNNKLRHTTKQRNNLLKRKQTLVKRLNNIKELKQRFNQLNNSYFKGQCLQD